MIPTIKQIRHILAAFMSLLLVWNAPSLADIHPLKGKLINLEVQGPQSMKDTMETFLTQHGFVIVDDDHAPSLKVTGSVETSGDETEGAVRYHIDKLRLRSSEGRLLYSSSGKSAQAYGSRIAADEDARYLLNEYLGQDRHLMSRLDDVQSYAYIQLSPRSLKKELSDIRQIIIDKALDMEESPEIRARLNRISQQQDVLKGRIAALAQQVKGGNGRISVKALLATQKQLLRALKTPHVISGNCKDVESEDFSSVEAILITVPAIGGTRIRSGTYAIYGENQRLVYEETENEPGPRVFSSLALLKMSSFGRYFKSPGQYLKIEAVNYYPGDRAVIVTRCDADAILKANAAGVAPNAIFKKGRVILMEKDTN